MTSEIKNDGEIEELKPSELGSKNHWDEVYNDELNNFVENGLVGDVWFGEEIMKKIVKYVIKKETIKKSDRIADLGCGNGAMLLELAKENFENLTGIDYIETSGKLSQLLWSSNGYSNIKFQTLDMLNSENVEKISKFNVCLDKGTYDAISLITEASQKESRTKYLENVNKILMEDGLFIVTSCNWTSKELISQTEKWFSFIETVPTSQFTFGGKKGNLGSLFKGWSVINSTIFKKLRYIYPGFQSQNFKYSTKDERRYIPRRAVMYVPGNDERKLAKIPKLDVDCVVLDFEDGVAINKKKEARENVKNILDNGTIDFGRSEVTVRINSVESELFPEDIQAVLDGPNLPSSIHIPKVDSVNSLKKFFESGNNFLKGRKISQRINLIIFIESAKSLLDLKEICQSAFELSQNSFFVPDALVFGSDDFCADIGATRTNEAKEILTARQQLLIVAKAFKLQAIDIVYIDYKDNEGFKRQALEGAQMGFTGKQVIHPGQIELCQNAFTPSKEKIEWAKELVKGFEEHQLSGKGAFNFRGSMIDMPLVLQAKNILQFEKLVKNK